MLGGRPFAASDCGYGEARYFSPAQVACISSALASITPEAQLAEYDSKKMVESDIYPSIWARPEERKENLDYVSQNFVVLRDYVKSLSTTGKALLVSIT